MEGKTRVLVEFIFSVKGSNEEIRKSIIQQIHTDLNQYWQTTITEPAQMIEMAIKKIETIK